MLTDTVNLKTFIIASKEIGFNMRRITDVVVIEPRFMDRNNFIQIGSFETNQGIKTDAFIIAIEEEKTDSKPDSNGVFPARPSKSIKIIKAWTFDCSNNKIRKISLKRLYRINEGYYRD